MLLHWTHYIRESFRYSFGVSVLGKRLFLELDDPAADADRHSLRAIAGPQLFHNVLDVDLHRLFRDE